MYVYVYMYMYMSMYMQQSYCDVFERIRPHPKYYNTMIALTDCSSNEPKTSSEGVNDVEHCFAHSWETCGQANMVEDG